MEAAPLTLSICLPDPLLDHPRHLRPHDVRETLQPLLEKTMTGVCYSPSEPLSSPQGDHWWQQWSQRAPRKNPLKPRGRTQPIARWPSAGKESFHTGQGLPHPLTGSRLFFLLFPLPGQAQQNLGVCCQRRFAKTHATAQRAPHAGAPTRDPSVSGEPLKPPPALGWGSPQDPGEGPSAGPADAARHRGSGPAAASRSPAGYKPKQKGQRAPAPRTSALSLCTG